MPLAVSGANFGVAETGTVADFEGGQRITTDSEYYAILRKWIADGAQLHTNAARVARIEVDVVRDRDLGYVRRNSGSA